MSSLSSGAGSKRTAMFWKSVAVSPGSLSSDIPRNNPLSFSTSGTCSITTTSSSSPFSKRETDWRKRQTMDSMTSAAATSLASRAKGKSGFWKRTPGSHGQSRKACCKSSFTTPSSVQACFTRSSTGPKVAKGSRMPLALTLPQASRTQGLTRMQLISRSWDPSPFWSVSRNQPHPSSSSTASGNWGGMNPKPAHTCLWDRASSELGSKRSLAEAWSSAKTVLACSLSSMLRAAASVSAGLVLLLNQDVQI
mmetsp:Transcript_75880/g.173712  ORF Transcript_75880/g.173712 Transcript_75880/m.173712 type:complete len:251 (-) Transcript_75880:991-1743(-)